MPNEKDWIAEVEVGSVQFAFMRDGSIKVGGKYSTTYCSVGDLSTVVSIHRLLNGGADKVVNLNKYKMPEPVQPLT